MKTATAILFALVLVTAQLPAMSSPLPWSKPTAKACCHCGGKMACCAQQPDSSSSPAAPVRVSTQNDFFIPALTLLRAVESANETAPVFSVRSSAAATIAPIYEQYCALLI